MILSSWSVINNEIDYIQNILDSHLPWLDFMYFLDTGSTDGTKELLLEAAEMNPKVIVEIYKDSFTPEYNVEWKEMRNPFPECEVRNYALSRIEELLGSKTDWFIQLDGDEVFLFKTREILEVIDSKYNFIGHSTINPVCELEYHPIEQRGQYKLFDPHVRIWKPKPGIKFVNNPVFGTKQFHCLPIPNSFKHHAFHNPATIFINDPIHFHLHWMYGKKVEIYYKNLGQTDRKEIINTQHENEFSKLVPQVFWDKRKNWINV